MDADAKNEATPNDPALAVASAQTREEKNLNQLAILHYAFGALTALSTLLMIPFLLDSWEIAHWIGRPALSDSAVKLLRWVRFIPGMDRPEYDDQVLGLTLLIAIVPTMALLSMHGLFLACIGRWLARRRRYRTTFVFSIFHLTNIPMGTALSAVTLITLKRAEVKQQIGRAHV